jgi:hypothetical protein
MQKWLGISVSQKKYKLEYKDHSPQVFWGCKPAKHGFKLKGSPLTLGEIRDLRGSSANSNLPEL